MKIKNQKCPICENNEVEIIGHPKISLKAKKYVRADHKVVKCVKCGFYFVSPSVGFSGEEWEDLYNEDYFNKMTKWWAARRKSDRKERLDRLEKYASGSIVNFLDVGCGEGYLLSDAVNRGWRVHGLDIVDNRGSFAKKGPIIFTQGDIYSAKYPNNYFDCVYMDSVLEHVPDPIAYLTEINRIMKKGAVLFIAVPNEDCLFNDTKKILYLFMGRRSISSRIKPFISPFHINGFTKKSLQASALRTKYEIVHLNNIGGQYEFLKFKIFSRAFMIHIFLLPIHLIAMLIRKQIYFDTIWRKN